MSRRTQHARGAPHPSSSIGGPRVRCSVCDKALFVSKEDARGALQAAQRLPAPPGEKVPVRVYWEPKCGWWHLTSQPGRFGKVEDEADPG